MTNMTNQNKLEFLAAKLYCLWATSNCLYPPAIQSCIKELGKVTANIPLVPDDSEIKEQQEDKAKWITVSRAELEYIHKALEDALATPKEELLPDSVTHAESMLFKILTRIVSKSTWNANTNETNERNEN